MVDQRCRHLLAIATQLIHPMTKTPPIHELEFLRLTGNHAEYARKLQALTIPSSEIGEYAKHVTTRWFRLAEAHLVDANSALASGRPRATLSRSYYAAYNASKAVRYLCNGFVSLKGDDHQRASELPPAFPDHATWGKRITTLYENRLRADYDNWTTTRTEFTLTPLSAILDASAFLAEARAFLLQSYGLSL